MKRRGAIRADRRGGTAVEFALVMPIFLSVVLLSIQAGLAFQQWNAMHMVSSVVARCVAIASPRCTTRGANDDGAAVAYAVETARSHAVASVTPDLVTIATATSPGGARYIQVTIRAPASILGTTIMLSAVGGVPMR